MAPSATDVADAAGAAGAEGAAGAAGATDAGWLLRGSSWLERSEGHEMASGLSLRRSFTSVCDSLRKLGVVNFFVLAGVSKSNDFAGETTISIITSH